MQILISQIWIWGEAQEPKKFLLSLRNEILQSPAPSPGERG